MNAHWIQRTTELERNGAKPFQNTTGCSEPNDCSGDGIPVIKPTSQKTQGLGRIGSKPAQNSAGSSEPKN